jgi:biopolymer transport protein ExbB/TolQ
MTKFSNLTQAVTRSPIAWGLLGAAGFYALIYGGPLDTPFVKRYFTNHPVEYVETVMFAIGLAALLLRLAEIVVQYAGMGRSPLAAARPAPGGQSIEAQCRELLAQLDRARQPQQHCYLGRLRAAIEYVQRRGDADGLDDRLMYLADVDAARAHAGLALFRVIVWAVPITGFLGTVIGITMALNGIDKNAMEQSMWRVLEALGLKFDTTTLALAMSIVLMFVHFFVDRGESMLLEEVDRRAEEDLLGRFPQLPSGAEGQLAAVRRMAETMLQASERLVQRQAALWQQSLEEAAARWAHLGDGAAEAVKKGLTAALTEGLQSHAQQLAAAGQAAAEQMHRHCSQLQQGQAEGVQAIAGLQAAMTRQAEVLHRAVEAAGQVSSLEDALNRNLATLAGAKHFEQTVLGLAAALHLLNARLSETGVAKSTIQLDPARRAVHAA